MYENMNSYQNHEHYNAAHLDFNDFITHRIHHLVQELVYWFIPMPKFSHLYRFQVALFILEWIKPATFPI